jgi:hypothetical protein
MNRKINFWVEFGKLNHVSQVFVKESDGNMAEM